MLRFIAAENTSRYSTGSPGRENALAVAEPPTKPISPGSVAAATALTASRRFSAGLMSALGALALLIGAAGIYGVLSALVGQRTRELGVRAALGATAARLVRETLVDAGRWLLLGAGIGVAAAWAIGGVLSSLLFGVTPRDPLIYALAVALLLIVGLIAAWLPARRAGRVDPLIVLRAD